MAKLSNTPNTYTTSLKLLLISTLILSMAVMLKLSTPLITHFASTQLPLIHSFLLSCLQPPYLYLLLNFIIVTIAASSKLQSKLEEPVASLAVSATEYACDGIVLTAAEEEKVGDDGSEIMMGGGDGFVGLRTVMIKREDSMEFDEKPLVSARFGHRKSPKPSPEGKALRVSKPKRQDTLENTWKTITEGRPMPLTRHLRKSDTWDSLARQDQTTTPPKMRKAETFNDHTNTTTNSNNNSSNNSPLGASPASSGRHRREPSLSQDELNRRVEAFIKKFNEEMRLQRQESLNQYHEMIRRGAH